jgi:hypothetical protein
MNGVRAIGAIIRMMTNQYTSNTHITKEESTHVTTVLGTTVRALTDEAENS